MVRGIDYFTASILILSLIFIPTGFAQYDPNGLFQFSRYWQQTPSNETSYSLNLDPGPLIDEGDLLQLVEGWRYDLPTPTPSNAPTLTNTPTSTYTPAPTHTPLPPDFIVTLPGGVTMDFMEIPSGSFQMGRYPGEQDSYDREDPQHQVTIADDFYMSKYEVTKAQWEAVIDSKPWSGRSYVLDDPNSPAVCVSWIDAQEFINLLNRLDQGTFRLPSEAEWEYACRAGTTTRFYWADDPDYTQIEDDAWYGGNAYNQDEKYAHVVGLKKPNTWGLFDMSGNACEWCQDWYHSIYTDAPADGSAWESPISSYRVLRGGGWDNNAMHCRSAYRTNHPPDNRNNYIGLRLVRTQ